MAMVILKSFGAGLAGAYLESNYGPDVGTGSLGLSKLFGVTPLILSGMSFWILVHGSVVVGASRAKFIELAKKDGEKDVEERYDLPNLYAQGTSKHVRAYNCLQRSHQHIFETFPSLCWMSMLGATHYPITAAGMTIVYCIGRVAMSLGYANSNGDASKRYGSPLAPLIWNGYIGTIAICMISCLSFVMGGPIV